MGMDFHSKTENVRTCPDIRGWQDPTVQSQYSASPTILALAKNFRFAVDPNIDFSLFYNVIFDVDSAQGVGLDIWGRIVAIPRELYLTNTDDYLGFYGSLLEPFNQEKFYRYKFISDVYELGDEAYRKLIMWKAMANISTADAATLNALLVALFDDPEKYVYILDMGGMSIRLVIEFELDDAQRAILYDYGLIARGAAVGFEWLEVPYPVLGFDGTGLHPFSQAPFFIGGIQRPESRRIG